MTSCDETSVQICGQATAENRVHGCFCKLGVLKASQTFHGANFTLFCCSGMFLVKAPAQ